MIIVAIAIVLLADVVEMIVDHVTAYHVIVILEVVGAAVIHQLNDVVMIVIHLHVVVDVIVNREDVISATVNLAVVEDATVDHVRLVDPNVIVNLVIVVIVVMALDHDHHAIVPHQEPEPEAVNHRYHENEGVIRMNDDHRLQNQRLNVDHDVMIVLMIGNQKSLRKSVMPARKIMNGVRSHGAHHKMVIAIENSDRPIVIKQSQILS